MQVLAVFQYLVGNVDDHSSLLSMLGLTATTDDASFIATFINVFSQDEESTKMIAAVVKVLSRSLLMQSSTDKLRRYLILEKAVHASYRQIKTLLASDAGNHLVFFIAKSCCLFGLIDCIVGASKATSTLLDLFTI